MVKAVDPLREFSGVHPDDEGLLEHEQTVWHWTGLDVVEERHVQDSVSGFEDGATGPRLTTKTGTVDYLRLKFGMRPPERFGGEWRDEAHPLVRRGKLVPTDAFLGTIPRHVRKWLANRIAEATLLSEADAGKSSPPSSSRSEEAAAPTAASAGAPTTSS